MDNDLRLGGINKSEINGDDILTERERRFYSLEKWKELFFTYPDTIPFEGFFIQDNPRHFECLLELEPAATPGRHYTNLALNDLVKHYCPKEADILDVGCGRAGFVHRIEHCHISGHYQGVDIQRKESWKQIEDRQIFKIKARFQEMKAECMTFDQQFDFVVSSHSLEHQEFPQESLNQTFSAMRPGAFGLFFLPAPWAYFLYGRHGWRNFPPKRIHQLFTNAGFQVERVYGLGGLPSFLLHVLVITWIETAIIYEILTFERLHWRLGTLLKHIRYPSIRKNKTSLLVYKYLSKILLPLDKYLPRPHHAYCVVIRRPKDPIS